MMGAGGVGKPMPSARGRPVFASEDWMLEQQIRAEMEAEAWRLLRQEAALPAPEPQAPPEPSFDHHSAGSAMLKGLVRFALAGFGAYLAYLASWDARLGEFEIWLATGAGFLVSLAFSMFGPAREFVHMLAETARWVIIVAVALGAVWVMVQMA
jgi:hypothetical protein